MIILAIVQGRSSADLSLDRVQLPDPRDRLVRQRRGMRLMNVEELPAHVRLILSTRFSGPASGTGENIPRWTVCEVYTHNQKTIRR